MAVIDLLKAHALGNESATQVLLARFQDDAMNFTRSFMPFVSCHGIGDPPSKQKGVSPM
jgi:hypothetical protein